MLYYIVRSSYPCNLKWLVFLFRSTRAHLPGTSSTVNVTTCFLFRFTDIIFIISFSFWISKYYNTTTQLTRMFDFVDSLGSNSTTCPLWTPSTRPATAPAHCVCSGCCLFFPGCHSWHVHWHARFRSSVPSCAALFWRFSVPEELFGGLYSEAQGYSPTPCRAEICEAKNVIVGHDRNNTNDKLKSRNQSSAIVAAATAMPWANLTRTSKLCRKRGVAVW